MPQSTNINLNMHELDARLCWSIGAVPLLCSPLWICLNMSERVRLSDLLLVSQEWCDSMSLFDNLYSFFVQRCRFILVVCLMMRVYWRVHHRRGVEPDALVSLAVNKEGGVDWETIKMLKRAGMPRRSPYHYLCSRHSIITRNPSQRMHARYNAQEEL